MTIKGDFINKWTASEKFLEGYNRVFGHKDAQPTVGDNMARDEGSGMEVGAPDKVEDRAAGMGADRIPRQAALVDPEDRPGSESVWEWA